MNETRLIGYGVPYTEPVLAVACPQCRAPIGAPCTGRKNRHAGRTDRMLNLGVQECRKVARSTGDNLWCNAPAHPCGTSGVHTMAECAPLEAGR